MDVTKNIFAKGLNSDLNKSFISTENYTLPTSNVGIVETGTFLALQNIKGTVNVQSITSITNTVVLGAFESKYKINTTLGLPCITVFTATTSGNFKIWCYDITNDTLYELYQSAIAGDYLTDDRVIDAKLFSEEGVDSIYFTDNYNEPRKLRCEIPAGYSPNFLTSFDLSLLRRGANGKISGYQVVSGGSLFTGSYQFAYQMLTPDKKKYTKWSLLTNPIPVFSGVNAGVGLSSNQKIMLTVVPSEDELTNYTHFRLAILENIYPEETLNTNCSVTDIMEVVDFISGSLLADVPYKANLQNNLLPLSEVVVDHAAIEHVKTLEIRDNRLFFGNVTYKNLEYDNGTPEIATGSIIKQNVLPQDENNIGNYVGYFRDEVYRFAISYFDDNGNYSSPVPLDMTNVVSNESGQTGFQDMKFPKRSQVLSATRYSILSGVNPVNLGLQLTGIDNHPTWARGFVILRRERLKNIQWQSPLIPMMPAYGIGALQHYPTRCAEGEPDNYVDLVDTKPMGPSNTFIPMNLFLPKLREIYLNKVKSGSGVNRKWEGEAPMRDNSIQSMSMVFPPQSMYTQNSKYVFNQSNKLETVDACKLNTLWKEHDTSVAYDGNEIESSVSGTFYALRDDLYYYDDAHSGAKAALRSSTFVMNGFKDFDNFTEGTSLNGKDVLLYSNLTTEGLSWDGVKPPSAQRCAVVDINNFTPINNSSSLTFAAGGTTVTAYDINGFYLTGTYGTTSTERATDYINTIEIVNCISELSDDRYGATEAPASYVWTGTKVVFTNAELPTVQAGTTLPKTVDVWGGDCIVSAHTFKLTDTTFMCVNQQKFATGVGLTRTQVVDRWGRSFYDKASGASSELVMPVALKNNAIYLQIYLESEFNGYVMDYNHLGLSTGSTYLTNSLYGVNYNAEESGCRVPLNYNYNLNISKKNNDKVFTSVDQNIPAITELKSRIMYSDIKLYQTQTEGFDIFRVLNYYDLLEGQGKITKLVVLGDSLYALQDSAVNYLGLGERVLETTDANQLSVRTGDVVGNVITIDNRRGCQHLRSVVNAGNAIFFADVANKSVNKLQGQQLELISSSGLESTFRTLFSSTQLEKNLIGVYDPIKKEYWIGTSAGTYCYIWNDALELWVSNYEFANNNLLGGLYTNKKMYVIGAGTDTNTISVHEMYTGANTYFMGVYVVPEVTFIVNPEPDIAKRFDAVLINSSDRLNNLNMTVEREAILGTQVATGIDLATVSSRGEGNFKVKTLRDASGARLRGLNSVYNIEWQSSVSAPQVSLASVLSSYTLSAKIF